MASGDSGLRRKLSLDDIVVESFDPAPIIAGLDAGTIRGYESEPSACQSCDDTACYPDSCFSEFPTCQGGGCGTFDTCAAQCASTIQMC